MSVELANSEYWKRLGLDPGEFSDNNREAQRISIINQPTGALKDFCQELIQGNVPSKKNDIATLLLSPLNPQLNPIAQEIHILEKFYKEVCKKAIRYVVESSNLNFEPETKNLREYILYLYINNRFLLTAIRNLSVSEKRRSYTNYSLPGPVLPQFVDITHLEEVLNIELPNIPYDRLIRLESPQIISGIVLLVFKTESKEKRVELFDDSHYDKPAKWVVFELDLENQLISVKGAVIDLTVLLLNMISFVLTGTMEGPTKIHSNIPEDKPLVSEPDQEHLQAIEIESNLEFLSCERIFISLENSPLPGNPTLTLEGQVSIDAALQELENEYGLVFDQDQQTKRKYRISYKQNGITDTILVSQFKDPSRTPVFSKSIPWNDRTAIMNYLNQVN